METNPSIFRLLAFPASLRPRSVSQSTLAARTFPKNLSRPTSSVSKSTGSASSSSRAATARWLRVMLLPKTSRPSRRMPSRQSARFCQSRTSSNSLRDPLVTSRVRRTHTGSSVRHAPKLVSSVCGRRGLRPRLMSLLLRRNRRLQHLGLALCSFDTSHQEWEKLCVCSCSIYCILGVIEQTSFKQSRMAN